MTIHTIGHSDIPTNDFVRLLKTAAIETLVDVRSSPYSRYAPQFNRENLIRSLPPLRYLYMGSQLGGYPKDAPIYRGKHPDYDLLRKQDFYIEGLNRLLEIAQVCKVAIMCSEEDPFTCHRRALIGFDLRERGVKVIHIRHDRSMCEDDYKDMSKIQLSLF
ncbi:DUF488 family protein [Candidatus Magnetominusculus dajiuhuensis]|uniref:DUF488 domain-containing protein n=1 Tax=Candidatus Magnetominusculus dajiuhuensis TaxID=3137712 RepID=UPI0019DEA425|nr:DUF488 domain-containing protein [Nitrospirota bacterium]